MGNAAELRWNAAEFGWNAAILILTFLMAIYVQHSALISICAGR